MKRIAALFTLLVVLSPHSVDAMDCTARVLFDPSRNVLVAGETSATSTETDPPPTYRTATVTSDATGISIHALAENTISAPHDVAVNKAIGTLTLDDVVFSSGGRASIPVSLNLLFDGAFSLYDPNGKYALGTVKISAAIGSSVFTGEIHVCSFACVEVQLGLLSGLLGRTFHDVDLTTPAATVPVNQPVTVTLTMEIRVVADYAGYSRAEAVFDTFGFAPTGSVFNVPDGITVNSENAIIVDNQYYSGNPVPTVERTWGAIKSLYQ